MAKKKKAEKPPRQMTRRQLSLHQRQRRRQRFVFIGGISIIVIIVLIVMLGWLLGEFIPLQRTVIRVNDTEFKAGYLIDAVKLAGSSQPDTNVALLVSSTTREIEQNELMRQGALQLGISVSDDEAKEMLEGAGIPVSDASLDIARAQLLRGRLYNEYFDTLVPESLPQAHILAMLLESERQALEVRARLQNSENFTVLAEELALNYYSKNVNQGDFGWHPRPILNDQLGSAVAVEYAFSGEVGELSQPVHDEEIYKQVGYWLINVLEKQFEEEARVQAVLLTSEEEAEAIKARLEVGDELAPIAEEYSHYSPSREKGGELGLVTREEISPAFDEYVFRQGVEIGVWSDPIRDEEYWSQGGYWLIKVVGRDDDRPLDEQDRDVLLGKAFDDWISQLWAESAAGIDETAITSELEQWVIERVSKDLQLIER